MSKPIRAYIHTAEYTLSGNLRITVRPFGVDGVISGQNERPRPQHENGEESMIRFDLLAMTAMLGVISWAIAQIIKG